MKTSYVIARGVFATYGYFVVDEDTKHAFLIDPGAQGDLFLDAIARNGWTVEKILLTHGHMDHMGAAAELRDKLGVPVLAHEKADEYLLNPELNLSAEYGLDIVLPGTQKFRDGDVIALDANPEAKLRVMYVPGHTDDSVAFLDEKDGVAFVGDTVYQGGPGLTVFPTGNPARLQRSLETKILPLPPETALCSGHAEPITVAELRQNLGV